jgi:hypothetical protein
VGALLFVVLSCIFRVLKLKDYEKSGKYDTHEKNDKCTQN